MLFQLKKSRLQFIYTISVHLFAIVSLLLIFSGWVLWTVLISSVALIYRYRALYFRGQDVVAIEHSRDAEWVLYDVDRNVTRVNLLSTSVVWRTLLILRFCDLGGLKQKTLVLFSDSVGREQYRSLRRCVRMAYL